MNMIKYFLVCLLAVFISLTFVPFNEDGSFIASVIKTADSEVKESKEYKKKIKNDERSGKEKKHGDTNDQMSDMRKNS